MTSQIKLFKVLRMAGLSLMLGAGFVGTQTLMPSRAEAQAATLPAPSNVPPDATQIQTGFPAPVAFLQGIWNSSQVRWTVDEIMSISTNAVVIESFDVTLSLAVLLRFILHFVYRQKREHEKEEQERDRERLETDIWRIRDELQLPRFSRPDERST